MEQLVDLVRGAGVVLLVVFLAAVILRMVREVALWPLTLTNDPSRPLPRTIPGSHGDPEW